MAGIDLLADEPIDLLADDSQHESRGIKALKGIGEDWLHFGRNLAAGGLEGLRGIGNIPHHLHLPYAPYFEPTNFSEMVGLEGEPSLADKLVQGAAQYAPSLFLPAANLGRAGEALSAIPKLGKFAKGAIEQAIPQSAYGATQNENPLEGSVESGLGSIVGSGIGSLIGKGINSLRPSQIYKSPLSKKELAESFKQVEGTNTDLGNVIQNPKLQRLYENVLPKYNGNTSLMMQKTGQQIVEKGEVILNKLLGNNSAENVPAQITKELTSEYAKHQKIKNNLYNDVDEVARKENLKLNLDEFSKKAKDYMSAIEDTTLLKHEPDAKQILSKLINYKNPIQETTKKGLLVNKNGEPILNEMTKQYPTLKEANILKGKLSNYANIYSQSSSGADRNIARIFKGLSSTLKEDINKSIESHGSDILKNTYKKAEENYAKNFSPFLDKDVYKFISGNADPETVISKFITRSNTSDLSGKLSKLADKLSKSPGSDQSNLLAYGYLSRALDNEGNFNPSKFATSIKQLGPNQLKALFPDKAVRKEVLNYKALINKNPRSLAVMFNPLTGQVNSDLNPHALSQLIGGLSGLAAGGGVGAVVGAVTAPILKSKVSEFAAKKLTDPVYRRKFINAIIANKSFELPKTTNALQKGGSISAGLAGSGYGNEPMELEVTGKRRK